jgi:hypothetical protein
MTLEEPSSRVQFLPDYEARQIMDPQGFTLMVDGSLPGGNMGTNE